MNRQSSLIWGVVTLLLLLTFSREIASLGVYGLWYNSVEQGAVFQTMLLVRLGSFLAGVALAGLVLLPSALRALSVSQTSPLVLMDGKIDLSPWAKAPQSAANAVRAVVLLALVLIGLATQANWKTWLAWWHGEPFGEVDAILGHDAALYVFTLPAVEALRALLLGSLFLSLVISAGIYAARGVIQIRLPDELDPDASVQVKMVPAARRHLAVLAGLTMLLLAIGPFLERFTLLHDARGLIDGPSYTVATTVMPLLSLSTIAMLFASWLVFRAVDQLRAGPVVLAVMLVFGTGALRVFVPDLVQRLSVAPNELGKERPYIASHIEATRRAWRLDGIEEHRLSADAELTYEDIQANRATVEGIRLWDEAPLLSTFRQVQEIRTYYEFHSVDHLRYQVDGRLRQVMTSARELDASALPPQAQTWVNKTLVYTHGAGLTLGPVNEITEDGMPVLWVQDIPPVHSHDVFRVDRPGLYFAENMNRPVIVRTNQAEFAYPTAEGNETTRYEGAAGIPVGGAARRALMAMVLGEFDILLNGDIQSGSKLLLVRDVRERAKKIAPFLTIDPDAYLAVIDGRLVWFLEGYTHTDRYPYSATRRVLLDGRRGVVANWVRNKVKITVDAYDGDVTMYRMPGKDPILDVWSKVFPSVLTDASEMPDAIRAHLRVPSALFGVRAHLFSTYHMTNAETFYNREDQWEIPVGDQGRMEPYYTVMKLPGGNEDEFILMLPFTPRNKDNLAAWMVARNDGDQYGQMRVYRFPKDRLIYGPSQVTARIQQDDTISQSLTLWNQRGSRSVMGTLLVIPIDESPLYVQPLYLRAERGAIPELKRVIVVYRDEIVMEPTLEEGLARLFRGGTRAERRRAEEASPTDADPEVGAPDVPTLLTVQEAVEAARREWRSVRAAASEGRFGDMGRALDELGKALESLIEETQEVSPSPAAADLFDTDDG